MAARKPLLRGGNRVKRLRSVPKDRLDCGAVKIVLWSYESIFRVFGHTRRVFVRRSANDKMLSQCIVPTIKYDGGSVEVSV